MYSITNNKMGNYKVPFPDHLLPTSLSSATKQLHFSYNLVDLQKEIEKRTFYLGKFRRTEEAQHLLDLIGMSRDEDDLLYSFTKAAMADVFDQLSLNTHHIPKGYLWKTIKDPIAIDSNKMPPVKDNFVITPAVVNDGTAVQIDGSFGISANGVNNYTKMYPLIELELTVNTTFNVIGTNTALSRSKSVKVTIPSKNLLAFSANQWEIVRAVFPIELEEESSLTTAEKITSCTATRIIPDAQIQLWIDPVKLYVGDRIVLERYMSGDKEVSGSYEITSDTDTNNIVINENAKEVDSSEIMTEGIHYFFNIPEYLNMSSIDPLDNAIMEALVNRIIWKWLVLSYPNEAATYDTMYQDNLKSIAMRCNIFNKHWQQVPRIL